MPYLLLLGMQARAASQGRQMTKLIVKCQRVRYRYRDSGLDDKETRQALGACAPTMPDHWGIHGLVPSRMNRVHVLPLLHRRNQQLSLHQTGAPCRNRSDMAVCAADFSRRTTASLLG